MNQFDEFTNPIPELRVSHLDLMDAIKKLNLNQDTILVSIKDLGRKVDLVVVKQDALNTSVKKLYAWKNTVAAAASQ